MTLDGKKTYITAVVAALASFALAMGWLSQRTVPGDPRSVGVPGTGGAAVRGSQERHGSDQGSGIG